MNNDEIISSFIEIQKHFLESYKLTTKICNEMEKQKVHNSCKELIEYEKFYTQMIYSFRKDISLLERRTQDFIQHFVNTKENKND